MKIFQFSIFLILFLCIYYALFPSARDYDFNFARYIQPGERIEVEIETPYQDNNLVYSITTDSEKWDMLKKWFKSNTNSWKKKHSPDFADCTIKVRSQKLELHFNSSSKDAFVILKKDGRNSLYAQAIEPGELNFLILQDGAP